MIFILLNRKIYNFECFENVNMEFLLLKDKYVIFKFQKDKYENYYMIKG